jgi:hypothetical protein
MVPSNQLEIVLFWTIGIAIAIFAGVVIIYANYFPLPN